MTLSLTEPSTESASAGRRRNRRALSWNRRLYLVLPAVAAGLVLVGQLTVAAVDPYNLHPWSPVRPITEDGAIGLAPHLLEAVRRGNADTVMIGGSTSMGFRPQDMERLIDGTRAAVNLSYRGPRPNDLGVVFDKAAEAETVERVLLSLDLVYLLPERARNPQFPFQIYEGGALDRIFHIDRQAYGLAWRLLRGGELSLPDKGYAANRKRLRAKYEAWHRPASAARETRMIENARVRVGEQTHLRCDDFGAVKNRLVPFARTLSRAGKTLDVILPPYALSFYAWVLSLEADLLFIPRAPLEASLMLRRCVVDALDGMEGVRVFAFDGERWITDDLANYHDAGHIYNEAIYRYMLQSVNAGRHQLTAAGFQAYADDLRTRVARYAYTSSRLAPGSSGAQAKAGSGVPE